MEKISKPKYLDKQFEIQDVGKRGVDSLTVTFHTNGYRYVLSPSWGIEVFGRRGKIIDPEYLLPIIALHLRKRAPRAERIMGMQCISDYKERKLLAHRAHTFLGSQ